MSDQIALVGAGGHGKVVLDALLAAGADLWGVVDDDPSTWHGNLLGIPVRGPRSVLDSTVSSVAYGVGDNQTRRRLAEEMSVPGVLVVHPRAVVSPRATLKEGAVVLATAVVQVDACIETGAIINAGAVIEHDCIVGAFAHIAPHATLAGGVRIGDGSLIGAGAVVLPGIFIGDRTTIGAGAVVISDVPSDSTVVGVPARPIDRS